MKNIGLMGGSFSPPTKGHLYVANSVLESMAEIDEVWLQPAYKHRFGKDKEYIPNRLELLMALETPNIKISTYEIDNHLSDGTLSTLKHMWMNPEMEDYNFSIIIGADCVNDFERWKNYEELANSVPFVIVPRKGYELDSYKGILSHFPHTILDSVKATNFSSTEVRRRLKNHESIEDLVPKKVSKILGEQNEL